MALWSWVMVKVNSWGNKWESWRGREERKGSDARDLMRGKGEEIGSEGERRVRPELILACQLDLRNICGPGEKKKKRKIKLLWSKVFHLRPTTMQHVWTLRDVKLFIAEFHRLKYCFLIPHPHNRPTHTRTDTHSPSPLRLLLCFLPLVNAALFLRGPLTALQPCKT